MVVAFASPIKLHEHIKKAFLSRKTVEIKSEKRANFEALNRACCAGGKEIAWVMQTFIKTGLRGKVSKETVVLRRWESIAG